jgi:hypothetical protein
MRRQKMAKLYILWEFCFSVSRSKKADIILVDKNKQLDLIGNGLSNCSPVRMKNIYLSPLKEIHICSILIDFLSKYKAPGLRKILSKVTLKETCRILHLYTGGIPLILNIILPLIELKEGANDNKTFISLMSSFKNTTDIQQCLEPIPFVQLKNDVLQTTYFHIYYMIVFKNFKLREEDLKWICF